MTRNERKTLTYEQQFYRYLDRYVPAEYDEYELEWDIYLICIIFSIPSSSTGSERKEVMRSE